MNQGDVILMVFIICLKKFVKADHY